MKLFGLILMLLACRIKEMSKQQKHLMLRLTKYFMDLKLSLCNAGKPTRMRHKNCIKMRRRYLLIYTREVNGKEAGFDIFFSQGSRMLEEHNLRYFIS
jgi:hypothetical protein